MFADILDEAPQPRRGMFADILDDDEPRHSFIESPESDARAKAFTDTVLGGMRSATGWVGDKLQALRRATTDRLARAAARRVGYDPTVRGEGPPRDATAPELLMTGLLPPRTPGGRATSRNWVAGGIDVAQRATGLDRMPGMPEPETIVEALPDVAVRLLGGAPGGLGDLDALVAQNPKLARAFHLAEDVVRVPAEAGAGIVTDPASAGGALSIARGLGAGLGIVKAAARADQALAATGVALGTTGAIDAAAQAHEHLIEGDLDAFVVDLARLATSAGMGAVAKRGLNEINAAIKNRAASIDTGRASLEDPALIGDERTAVENAVAAERQAAVSGAVDPVRAAVADVRAADPLDVAGLTRGQETPGRLGAVTVEGEPFLAVPPEVRAAAGLPPEPRLALPGAHTNEIAPPMIDVDRPMTAMRLETAALGRARTGSGLVEREGPVGELPVRDEGAPGVRMSPRALEVARELGVSAEPIPTEAVGGGERLPRGGAAQRDAIRKRFEDAIAARKAEAARSLRVDETEAAQKQQAAETVAGVGPDRDVARRLADRSTTTAGADEHLARIPRVGKQLASARRGYEETRDTVTARERVASREAVRALGDSDTARAAAYEPVQKALEGEIKPETLAPAQRRAYDADRGGMRRTFDLYNDARELAGLDRLKFEADYFPRVRKGSSILDIEAEARDLAAKKNISVEAAMQQINGVDPVISTRTDRRIAAERQRTGELTETRTDPGVVDEYYGGMARRIAELRHFGANGAKINALLAQIPQGRAITIGGRRFEAGDREFAQSIFDRTRGAVPSTNLTKALDVGRAVEAWSKLGLSFLRQTESAAQTALRGGVRNWARATVSQVGREVKASDLVRPRRLAKAVRQSMRGAGLRAEEIGASHENLAAELADASVKAGPRASWLEAMSAMDRTMRSNAVRTWDVGGPEMLRRAKAGDLAERRNLESMNIDWQRIDPGDRAAMDVAAKRFSDATQYRPSIGNLPPAASSPLGRTMFQFLSFINSHTKTVKYVASEAAKGNAKPAARFVAVGLPIALANNQLLDLIKGYGFEEKDIESGKVSKAIADEVAGRRSSNPLRGGNESLAVLGRGLASLGVGMVYQALLERGASSDSLASLAPLGKDVEDVAQGHPLAAATNLIPNAPGLSLVKQGVREAVTGKKSVRPGWGGAAIDAVTGLVTGEDEAAKRDAQRAAADIATRRREATAEGKTLFAPKPGPDAARRLSDSERSARKAELTVELAKALRDKDQKARLRIIIEARRLRRPFSRREIASLSGRVYRPADEEEE